MANGHYLEKDRLAHVIAAIQILAVSDQATGKLDRWIAELESSEALPPGQIDEHPIKYAERKKWAAVFEQHPEFFKSYTLHGEPRVLLRWRYAQSFNARARSGTDPPPDATDRPGDAAKPAEDTPIVGLPLTSEQIQVLVSTAIELHSAALAAANPDRWSPMAMVGVGAALGTVVGGAIVVLLGWMQLARATRLFD